MMMWGRFTENKEFIKTQYKENKWSENSGLSLEELKIKCAELYNEIKGLPKEIIKAKIFEFIMDNGQIEVSPYNLFHGKINHGNILTCIRNEWKAEKEGNELKDIMDEHSYAQSRLAYKGEVDFSHTSPDWNNVIELGLTGLLKRLEEALGKEGVTEKQKVFYESCIIVYKSVIRFIRRLALEAERLADDNDLMKEAAKSLNSLTKRAPESMLETMQLSFVFYYLQTYVEGVNLRSVGGIDRLYYPAFKNDIKSGKYTEEQIREITDYYFFNYSALGAIANTPFYLCGEDENGVTVTNELTHIFIEEYDKLDIIDPKIHIRYTKDLSEDFIKKVLSVIAAGRNSIVFLNDEVIIKALVGVGVEERDARNYVPIGCYEPAAMGKEVPCTCSGRVNIPKAIELAMSKGRDMADNKVIFESVRKIECFEDFMAEVKDVIAFFANQSMRVINSYEKHYAEINQAPLFSATMDECVESGKDAYDGGAKYNNTSINAFGLADAVDSIIAVKKAVFEEKRLTFDEFSEILTENWNGNEKLRLICKNKYPKYGNNINEADEIMIELTDYIADCINNKPNGRGGVYRCGMFSIDWYATFGKTTGALPNGRLAGEPISKNLNAVIGQDKSGTTGIINSVTKIDFTRTPNGVVLDLLLHSSVTEGDEGLCAMLGILKTYMSMGGFGLQINALNPDILKKAQQNPEKYRNLQVRLCGWNVYFVNLSKREQDEFIKMSELSAMTL